MVSPLYVIDFEKSGYAVVLHEQLVSERRFHEHPELYPIRLGGALASTSGSGRSGETIDLESFRLPGIWQFLNISDEPRYGWLDRALAKAAELSSGSDKAYAELALRQASHVSQREPRIYNAPGGGIVMESQTKEGILTLLIEDPIGVIVRTADDFRISGEFKITPHSINELLARYVNELRLLLSSQGH